MPGGWEWLIILVVLVVLFGARRLPELARSVGQSARVFKGEMKGMRDDDEQRGAARPSTTASAPPAQPAAQPPALPPGERTINEAPGTGATAAQPGDPARRADTDR